MNTPEATNLAFEGDTIARIDYERKDPASKLIGTPSFAQLVYKEKPNDQEVIDFFFSDYISLGGSLDNLDIQVSYITKVARPSSHSGTAQP